MIKWAYANITISNQENLFRISELGTKIAVTRRTVLTRNNETSTSADHHPDLPTEGPSDRPGKNVSRKKLAVTRKNVSPRNNEASTAPVAHHLDLPDRSPARQAIHPNESLSDRPIKSVLGHLELERSAERTLDGATDRASKRSIEGAIWRASERASDRANDRSIDRSVGRWVDRASD